MILLLAAAALASASPPAALPPDVVLARYGAALAKLREPRVFTVDYTLQQTGTRTLEQTHRVFRSGRDERDETVAVNGSRSPSPLIRIFRNRPYRYTVAALAPKPSAYDFDYVGARRDGKHVDYVFTLTPKAAAAPLTFTQLAIDGVTFLPQTVWFSERAHAGTGSVTFAKADRYWVARSASAQAKVGGGLAREQLAFAKWRFPKALPRSTFALPRPLPTVRPEINALR